MEALRKRRNQKKQKRRSNRKERPTKKKFTNIYKRRKVKNEVEEGKIEVEVDHKAPLEAHHQEMVREGMKTMMIRRLYGGEGDQEYKTVNMKKRKEHHRVEVYTI